MVVKSIIRLSRGFGERHRQKMSSCNLPFSLSDLMRCFKCLVFDRSQPAVFLSIVLNWVQIYHTLFAPTSHLKFNHMNNLIVFIRTNKIKDAVTFLV